MIFGGAVRLANSTNSSDLRIRPCHDSVYTHPSRSESQQPTKSHTLTLPPRWDSSPRADLEAELQILAAPDVEALIVGAQRLEPLAVNGEQTAGHGRRRHRVRRVWVKPLLPLRNGVPVELKHGGRGRGQVAQSERWEKHVMSPVDEVCWVIVIGKSDRRRYAV